jgi:hypothetical protein
MAFRDVELARTGDLDGLNFAGLVRLSFESDEDDGTESRPMTGRDIKGRDEQTTDCLSYVERRGGTYVHTYEEPNTSAYKRRAVRQPDGRTVYRVVRPVFEAALTDLKRGKAPNGQRLDGLVVYDIDRLTRDPRNLEDAIEVVEHFGKPIIDITGSLDLLTDNGRTMARVIVATANKSSETHIPWSQPQRDLSSRVPMLPAATGRRSGCRRPSQDACAACPRPARGGYWCPRIGCGW